MRSNVKQVYLGYWASTSERPNGELCKLFLDLLKFSSIIRFSFFFIFPQTKKNKTYEKLDKDRKYSCIYQLSNRNFYSNLSLSLFYSTIQFLLISLSSNFDCPIKPFQSPTISLQVSSFHNVASQFHTSSTYNKQISITIG